MEEIIKINPDNTEYIWNNFDEHAALLGLERKFDEDNIHFHNRITTHVPGNSTPQGMSHWISNIFDEDVVDDIVDTYHFFLEGLPMKPEDVSIYDTPYKLSDAYVKVIDGNVEYILDTKKPQYYSDQTETWKIFITPNGNYMQILQSKYPAENVSLEYLSLIDGDVHKVKESGERPE